MESPRCASAKDGQKTGDGHGVGFFIPLSPELAKQYPSLGDDDHSPPHSTFLYVGEVTKDQEPAFLKAAQEAISEMKGPVTGTIGPLDYFVHPQAERRVAITPIKFNADMAGLRWKLRDRLLEAGFQVDDSFPLVYSPHTTLGYLDGLDATYDGEVPTGQWGFNSIEVWGLPELHRFEFGGSLTQRVANLYTAKYQSKPAKGIRFHSALRSFFSRYAGVFRSYPNLWVKGGAARSVFLAWMSDQEGLYKSRIDPPRDFDLVLISKADGVQEIFETFQGEIQREDLEIVPTISSYFMTRDFGLNEVLVRPDRLLYSEKAFRDAKKKILSPSGRVLNLDYGDYSPRLALRGLLFALRERKKVDQKSEMKEALRAARYPDLLIHVFKAYETGVEDKFVRELQNVGNSKVLPQGSSEEVLLDLLSHVRNFQLRGWQSKIVEDAEKLVYEDTWGDESEGFPTRRRGAGWERPIMQRVVSRHLRGSKRPSFPEYRGKPKKWLQEERDRVDLALQGGYGENTPRPKSWAPQFVRDPKGSKEGYDRLYDIDRHLQRHPWQRPQKAVQRVLGKPLVKHQQMVERALREGEDVPSLVLEDYPELGAIRQASRFAQGGIRIYLDDERKAPPGWKLVRWPEEVIQLLKTGKVEEVSLDHDLGDDAHGTGYDVILWIEEAVATQGFQSPQIHVHTSNPSARSKMMQGVRQIQKLQKRFPTRLAASHKKSMALVKFLSGVARRLGVGEHVYVVGGAVRNFILDEPIKDIDVVIDSVALGKGRDAEWFGKQVQRAIPAQVTMTVNQYKVALLNIKGDWWVEGENLQGEDIEIATARTETYDEGGYKPTGVEPATIKEDVFRREFSFNTLLWRLHDLADGPDKAEILDLTGCGRKDLDEGWMRCPSDPDRTFTDDPSRMIRVVKFLVKYGFKVSPEVKAAVARNKAKVKNIPPSHLSQMLINVFFEGGIGKKALIELDKLGLLEEIKEVAQTNKAFRMALANWADKKASLEFLFDLMDLGMPTGNRISFLSVPERARLREITIQMGADESDAFVNVLQQPGKAMDMPALIREFGLKGKQVAELMSLAREALLDDPVLAANRKKLTERVREQYRGQKTAKTFELKVGDPVLIGKYLNSKGYIEGFKKGDKGDPMVIVRLEPKKEGDKGTKKEVKLFKLRYDESREQKKAVVQYAKLKPLRGQSQFVGCLDDASDWGKEAGKLDKSWLLKIRRGWLYLLKNLKFTDEKKSEDAVRQMLTFLDNLDEQLKFLHQGAFTQSNFTREGKAFQAAWKRLQDAIESFKARIYTTYSAERFQSKKFYEEIKSLKAKTGEEINLVGDDEWQRVVTEPQYVTAMYKKYPELEERGRSYVSSMETLELVKKEEAPKGLALLTKKFDAMLKHLYQDAKELRDWEAAGQQVEEPDSFTQFNLHGSKIVVDDRSLGPFKINQYIKKLDETYRRLKAKGLADIWYGNIFIECESCGGENENGAQFGVGGRYNYVKDFVRVFNRPAGVPQLLSHELAHRYWFKKMTSTQRARFTGWIEEGRFKSVSKYGESNAAEAFAEVVSYMVTGRDITRDQLYYMKAVMKLGSWEPVRLKLANPDSPRNFQQKLEELREAVQKAEALGHQTNSSLWIAWYMFYKAAKEWGEYVIDHLDLPPKAAKPVEMAVRLFSKRYGRGKGPKNLVKWFRNNEKRFALLERALKWPERTEGKFKIGPFTVHNTVQAQGKDLENAQETINTALASLRKTGVPDLSRMAYGDLYLVGQIARKKWAAWYMPGKDVIYLRPVISGVPQQESARQLVHELGHRLWAKALSQSVKKAWITHHSKMAYSRESGRIPEVGEVLPMVVNNKKVKVDRYEGPGNHKAVLVDVSSGGVVGTVQSIKLWEWMADVAHKMKFPTLYAATDAEEHFCESLSLKALGKLKGENLEAFNAIVVKEEVPGDVRLAMLAHKMMTCRVAARHLGRLDFDVNLHEFTRLGEAEGPVGEAVERLVDAWGGGFPERLGPEGPRVGTLYVYRDEEKNLHYDLVTRVATRYLEAKSLREWLAWIAQPFAVIWKHHKEFVQGPVDDAMDAIIKELAPKLVKVIGEHEVDSDVDEFLAGAKLGQIAKQRNGDAILRNKTDWEKAGYGWGYANAERFDGHELPAGIRGHVVQKALADFGHRVTEEMVVRLLKKVWHAINPVNTVKAIIVAVKKHGWKLGVGFALFELFEHFLLPSILVTLTGNPKMLAMATLPIGEVVYAIVFRILGRAPKELDKADPEGHLDWYEAKYGPVRIAALSRKGAVDLQDQAQADWDIGRWKEADRLLSKPLRMLLQREFTPRGMSFFLFYPKLRFVSLGGVPDEDLKAEFHRVVLQLLALRRQLHLSPLVVNMISDARQEMNNLLARVQSTDNPPISTWARINDVLVPLIVELGRDRGVYLQALQRGVEQWAIFRKSSSREERVEQMKEEDPETYALVVAKKKSIKQVDQEILFLIQDMGLKPERGMLRGRPVWKGADLVTGEIFIFDRDGDLLTKDEYLAKREQIDEQKDKLSKFQGTQIRDPELGRIPEFLVDQANSPVTMVALTDDMAKQDRTTRVFPTKWVRTFRADEEGVAQPHKVQVVSGGRYKGYLLDDMVNTAGRLVEGTSYTFNPKSGRKTAVPVRLDPSTREPYVTVADIKVRQDFQGSFYTKSQKKLYVKIGGAKKFKELRQTLRKLLCQEQGNVPTYPAPKRASQCIPGMLKAPIEGTNAVGFYFDAQHFPYIMQALQGMSVSKTAWKFLQDYYKELTQAEEATAEENLGNYSATALGSFKVSRKDRVTGKVVPFDLNSAQKKALAWLDANDNSGVCALETGVGKGLVAVAGIVKMLRDGMGEGDYSYKRPDGREVTTNGRFLLVTPPSLKGNVSKEAYQFLSDPRIVLNRLDEVTYEQFNRHHKAKTVPPQLRGVEPWKTLGEWDVGQYVSISFDEAHLLGRRRYSKVTQGVLNLWHPHKICLTASPMEKEPLEAYTLAAICNNKPLTTETKEGDANLMEMRRFKSRFCQVIGGRVVGVKQDPIVQQEMQTWVKRNIYHADKTKVGDQGLPSLTSKTTAVEMDPMVASVYQAVSKEFANVLQGAVSKFRDGGIDPNARLEEVEQLVRPMGKKFRPVIQLLNGLANDPQATLELVATMIETGMYPTAKGLKPIPKILRNLVNAFGALFDPTELRQKAAVVANPKFSATSAVIKDKWMGMEDSRFLLFSDDVKLCLKMGKHLSTQFPGYHAVGLRDKIILLEAGSPVRLLRVKMDAEALSLLRSDDERRELMAITGGITEHTLPFAEKVYRKHPEIEAHKNKNKHYQAKDWRQFVFQEVFVLPEVDIRSCTLLGSFYQYGFNLQSFDTVIHLDRDTWNAESMKQRTARAWRQGQEQPVEEITIDAIFPSAGGENIDGKGDSTLDEIRRMLQELDGRVFDALIRESQGAMLGSEWEGISRRNTSGYKLDKEMLELMASPYLSGSKTPSAPGGRS